MYICICHSVTDKAIKRCVRQGHDTFEEVQKELKVEMPLSELWLLTKFLTISLKLRTWVKRSRMEKYTPDTTTKTSMAVDQT